MKWHIVGAGLVLSGALASPAVWGEGAHDHHDHHHMAGGPAAAASEHEHHHAAYDVAAQGEPVPRLEIQVSPDAMSGWNLHLRVENFRFAPASVNGAHKPGEGHAHVYIDGKKFARLYGPWFHIPALAPGSHRLRVTLNTNTHQEIHADGQAIDALVLIGQ